MEQRNRTNKRVAKKSSKNKISADNNYTTNGKATSKKNKELKFSKRHPKLSLAIKLFIILMLVIIVIGAGIVVGMVYGMWGQDFEISEKELMLYGNSVLYDSE